MASETNLRSQIVTSSSGLVERAILLIRGHRVMLDADLADLYQISVGRLNEQVARKRSRFPEDFMFQLSPEEHANLKSQFAISSSWGGRRSPPYAFTEQGVAMLSSVLHSPRAVQVNIEIMRAFVRLREMLQTDKDLARKLDALEMKYDSQFKIVFQAIRELMAPPAKPAQADWLPDPNPQGSPLVWDMPRRLKLSRLQALAAEVSAREGKPSFMCIYRRGFGVELYGPAERGDAAAQFALGCLNFYGRAAESHTSYSGSDGRDTVCSYTPAFERHHPAAMKWLQQAADQGHAEARQLLEVVRLRLKDGVN